SVPVPPEDSAVEDPGKYIETWNVTRRVLLTPVTRQRTYLALTCPATDTAARNTQVDKSLWKDTFPAWSHLIDRIGDEVSWGVYIIIKCKAWSSGRIAILGVAVHAQPPNLRPRSGIATQPGPALSTSLSALSS